MPPRPDIILASTSPRRKDLLEQIGLPFRIVPSDYEEDPSLSNSPSELVSLLAQYKAAAVAQHHPNSIVIAADTVVAYHDRILGKPHTASKAKEVLLMLSGTQHNVFTGFTIQQLATKRVVSQVEETQVYFFELTEAEIDAYIATGEPLDKAGAYGIQGKGALLVKRIEGDFSNVIGLPLSQLMRQLSQFGIPLWS
jgi:septum formation protein